MRLFYAPQDRGLNWLITKMSTAFFFFLNSGTPIIFHLIKGTLLRHQPALKRTELRQGALHLFQPRSHSPNLLPLYLKFLPQ